MKSLALVTLLASPAFAADKVPVAMFWLGDDSQASDGSRVSAELTSALQRSKTARTLDGGDDRRALLEGGAASEAGRLVARAEQSFGKLRYAEGIRDLEAAERLLLDEVPIAVTQARLGAVERMLLVGYDQLGRAADAARAAERLHFVAGNYDDVAPLVARHWQSREMQPPLEPVRIDAELPPLSPQVSPAPPPPVVVFRNLQPAGSPPITVAGGDPSLDFIDIEAPGFRRFHHALGRGGEIRAKLVPEDRLGALVDLARLGGGEPPPELVAAIGQRVGAARVVVVIPDGPKLVVRVLNVKKGDWVGPSFRTDAQGNVAMDRIVNAAAPPPPAPAAVAAKAPEPPPKKKWTGSWGKWYTWVAAGGVVLLVGGLLIAQNVGSDSLKITISK
jgi:hypothetical protein